jgi:toxin ParE1/3/4
MAWFRFSPRAADDMADIGSYTINTWGVSQMVEYLSTIEKCASLLAINPKLGRPCVKIRPGLHRFEKAEHVIYYRLQPEGVLVSRVLHRSMNPLGHDFDEETEQ